MFRRHPNEHTTPSYRFARRFTRSFIYRRLLSPPLLPVPGLRAPSEGVPQAQRVPRSHPLAT